MTSHALEEENKKAYQFSDTKEIDLETMKSVFAKYLLLEDKYILDILIASILAHNLPGNPIWIMLVGPPSSGKSEILNATLGLPAIFPLSSLTPKTFASGYQGGKVALLRPPEAGGLQREILLFKDFTSILAMPFSEQSELMGQLREIYDGRFNKSDGTGMRINWEGKLGFLAGVTEAIDMRKGSNILGERFVQYRMDLPDREEAIAKALENNAHTEEMRNSLRDAFTGCVKYFASKGAQEAASDDLKVTINKYANFATIARTEVLRDNKSPKREIEYVPSAEMPMRFASALWNIARGLSLMEYEQEETAQIIKKICFGSIPKTRMEFLRICSQSDQIEADGRISNSKLSLVSGYSRITVERNMEELAVHGIVKKTKRTIEKNSEIMWHIEDKWRASIFGLGSIGDGIEGLGAGIDYMGHSGTSYTDEEDEAGGWGPAEEPIF